MITARYAHSPVPIRAQAAEHWELALAVNPPHPDGWFALGHCELKRPTAPAGNLPSDSSSSSTASLQTDAIAEGEDEAKALFPGEDRALQAFTRCVHQAPDHAQAWNNIAALHLKVCNAAGHSVVTLFHCSKIACHGSTALLGISLAYVSLKPAARAIHNHSAELMHC